MKERILFYLLFLTVIFGGYYYLKDKYSFKDTFEKIKIVEKKTKEVILKGYILNPQTNEKKNFEFVLRENSFGDFSFDFDKSKFDRDFFFIEEVVTKKEYDYLENIRFDYNYSFAKEKMKLNVGYVLIRYENFDLIKPVTDFSDVGLSLGANYKNIGGNITYMILEKEIQVGISFKPF